MAAAFKKMMEDGIGDELPEMPEAGEVWCYGIRHELQIWTKHHGLLLCTVIRITPHICCTCSAGGCRRWKRCR